MHRNEESEVHTVLAQPLLENAAIAETLEIPNFIPTIVTRAEPVTAELQNTQVLRKLRSDENAWVELATP